MTDIEAKALALVNEVLEGKASNNTPFTRLPTAVSSLVLLRAIERHEAFRQEVSDIVEDYSDHVEGGYEWDKLMGLIIPKPKPKPDPLAYAMTDDSIEAKALALLNEVAVEMDGHPVHVTINRDYHAQEALCRSIEQHEAFRQEVSDALLNASGEPLERFIIPKPKPDPLVEAMLAIGVIPNASALRAALEARGLEIEIKEKGQ
jgi:hypothetical protein